MPCEGGKSVASDLRRRFPDMEWLEGPQLHALKAGIEHAWHDLASQDEVAPAVIATVRADRAARGAVGHIMVFCRDARSAASLHFDMVAVRGQRACAPCCRLPCVLTCSIEIAAAGT
jgi:hypothetical protein